MSRSRRGFAADAHYVVDREKPLVLPTYRVDESENRAKSRWRGDRFAGVRWRDRRLRHGGASRGTSRSGTARVSRTIDQRTLPDPITAVGARGEWRRTSRRTFCEREERPTIAMSSVRLPGALRRAGIADNALAGARKS